MKQTSKKNVASHLKEDILQISKNEINVLKKLNEDENKDNKGDTGYTPPPTHPGPQTGGTTYTPKPQPKPKPAPPPPKTPPKQKKIFKFGTWIKNSQGQVYRVGLFRTVTRHDGILEGPTDVNAKMATVE